MWKCMGNGYIYPYILPKTMVMRWNEGLGEEVHFGMWGTKKKVFMKNKILTKFIL